jgi:hypothetical protein
MKISILGAYGELHKLESISANFRPKQKKRDKKRA